MSHPMPAAERWETGSAFAEIPLPASIAALPSPLLSPLVRRYGSGRQALMALVIHGRERYGWTALHVPAYYCEEVVASVAALIPVRRYDAGPAGLRGNPVVCPMDAVMAVSYFGAPPAIPPVGPAHVIIDATHDPLAPWLASVRGDYVFASLRKTLPLTDGGALWSRGGLSLPPTAPLRPWHRATASTFQAAMRLKAAYLGGGEADKQGYLELFAAGEADLRGVSTSGRNGISGISELAEEALRRLPGGELRERRIANAAMLFAELGELPGVRVHLRTLGVLLEFATPSSRATVRSGLIERDVFPAVLWPLAASPQSDFADRMLLLHTDFRYDHADLTRVATLVRHLCAPVASVPRGTAVVPPRRPRVHRGS